MRAVVFLGERELDLEEFPDPTPGTGEVVLEIKASGMCGTDLHRYRGPKVDQHLIAGHEPCGVVVAVGAGVPPSQASVGNRVMVHHYDGCGACKHCVEGWTQMCNDGSTVYGGKNGHGAHAPYMKVPAHTLVKLPEEITFKSGAAISCGTGTAFGALKRLELAGDETLVVFGQGPVGLSATLLAKEMGARVIAVDPQADRRSLATGFGADYTLDPTAVDVSEAIRELTNGLGAHKSVECSSNSGARTQSVDCLRKWGAACMVGVNGEITVPISDLIHKQTRILGSWTFSKTGQAECAQFILERGIDTDQLFSHEFVLDDAVSAYQLFDAQKMGKGVFLF